MKNFLDLLDTKDQSVNVNLVLSSIVDNGSPTVKVVVDKHILFDGKLDQNMVLTANVSIYTPFDIEIVMSDKQYSVDKETAVIIEQLSVDEWSLLPNYTHLVDYANDHDNSTSTNYLGFNGTWRLQVDKPFYQWCHQVTSQGWLLEPN